MKGNTKSCGVYGLRCLDVCDNISPAHVVTRANTVHTRTVAELRENGDTTFVKRSGTFNLPQSECCDGARCQTRYIYSDYSSIGISQLATLITGQLCGCWDLYTLYSICGKYVGQKISNFQMLVRINTT